MPRFILELFAFGGIILLILFLLLKNDNFNESLPLITLFVFAGYRLMPAIQQIYRSKVMLRFTEPVLEQIYRDFKDLRNFENKSVKDSLDIKEFISLKNVNFNYPGSLKKILKFKNLNIAANSKVALVGPTGSGKTTTLDLLLGLLNCDKSTLEVDGQIIDEINIKLWQNSIGYVPQQVYLSDDTIEANIAFGINPKKIDHDMVEKVSKISKIHDFIMDSLPEKYQTTVGVAVSTKIMDETTKLIIWDIAGFEQENHYKPYLRGAHGIIYVVDAK